MISGYIKIFSALLAVALLATNYLLPVSSSAATFNPSYIISDGAFRDYGSMNAAQIDSFLNTFSSSCISPNKGFKAPSLTGYSPSTGFTYGASVSAGNIIYAAAQVYGLSPKVILATMQKEQSLVTGGGSICSDPFSSTAKKRYTGAMGYNCPDGGSAYNYSGFELYRINSTVVSDVSGTCVNRAQTAGFSRQIIAAVWKLKFNEERSKGNVAWDVQKPGWDNSDDPPTCYNGYMTPGNRARALSSGTSCDQVFSYDGRYTIDSTAVTMQSGATASLYYYTPHLHGNQNFFDIFVSWFGNPNIDHSRDFPLVGDWDGDGDDTIGVKRGNEYILDNNNDGLADIIFNYGGGSEMPLVGDWDGNGIDTIGLKYGNKYFINNELDSSSAFRFFYGNGLEIPVVGDFDGNGTDTIGLRIGYKFFINNDLGPYSDFAFSYGSAVDVPIVGDFDGNGTDTIGLKIGNKYFINNGLEGSSDFRFVFVD